LSQLPARCFLKKVFLFVASTHCDLPVFVTSSALRKNRAQTFGRRLDKGLRGALRWP
jgi:hypothetical protein